MNKKKAVWGFLSLGIAILTIMMIASGSKEFSLDTMMVYLSRANKLWLVAGLLCICAGAHLPDAGIPKCETAGDGVRGGGRLFFRHHSFCLRRTAGQHVLHASGRNDLSGMHHRIAD